MRVLATLTAILILNLSCSSNTEQQHEEQSDDRPLNYDEVISVIHTWPFLLAGGTYTVSTTGRDVNTHDSDSDWCTLVLFDASPDDSDYIHLIRLDN